jgi:hypothetical protein
MISDRFTYSLRPLLAAACLLTSACQGSTGTGLPQAPLPQGSYGPGVNPNQAPQSRQQTESVSVPVEAAASTLDFSQFDGFGFAIELAKPTAAPATADPTASAAAKGKKAKPTASPSPSPSPMPTPTPTPTSKSHASPSPTPSGPRVDVKLTVYPDGTQKAPGDAESTAVRRVPVVKALMQPSVDVRLYSLGALRFTIPATEQESGRGFTVALYETRKYHKDRLIDWHTDVAADGDVVRADKATDSLKLSKGHAYTVILFGDALPATPGPYSGPQYPGTQMQYPPGQNPGQPGQLGQPFPPQPGQPYPPPRPGFPTPTPYPTPSPDEEQQ